jgi:hypothetical protein
MLTSEILKVGAPIAPSCDVVQGPHLRWELQQVMARVRPDDLSAAEIAGLLAILIPAHCRVIGSPAARPAPRVLGVAGEHPMPNLAQ